MSLLMDRIELLMRLAGYVTASMLAVALFPELVLGAMFGVVPEDPLMLTIVRNWGALIGLVGLGLIYATYVPGARRLALMIAVASKSVFIVLFLTTGRAHLDGVLVALIFDGVVVAAFLVYLAFTPSEFPRRGAPESAP